MTVNINLGALSVYELQRQVTMWHAEVCISRKGSGDLVLNVRGHESLKKRDSKIYHDHLKHIFLFSSRIFAGPKERSNFTLKIDIFYSPKVAQNHILKLNEQNIH